MRLAFALAASLVVSPVLAKDLERATPESTGLNPAAIDKKTRAKACRLLTNFYDALAHPVYATADERYGTAPGLLAKLGFTPSGVSVGGRNVLVRRPNVRV